MSEKTEKSTTEGEFSLENSLIIASVNKWLTKVDNLLPNGIDRIITIEPSSSS